MRFRIIGISLFILLFACGSVWAKPANEEPLIRVGLLTGQSSVTVAADASFYLLTDNRSGGQKAYRAGEKLTIAVAGGRLTVNGATVPGAAVRLAFSAASGAEVNEAGKSNRQGRFLLVNGKRYRGIVEIRRQEQGLTVINILPLEDYLYGVVPREIPPAWPLEAVRAQAVAARSYALASGSKHAAQGFDVCTTVDCQVYGGRDAEAERSNQAVDDTRGMVLTYQGKVITAFFHASSGGHTENSENVWGGALPYLRGVPDFDQQSPRFSWERRVGLARLTELLRSTGVGEITAIALSPLGRQPVKADDRGVSGRVKTVVISGKTGSVRLSGAQLSSLLGLPSTLFEVAVVRDGTATASRGNGRWQVKDIKRDTLLLSGRGAGHGVGMSQWGAKAMAEKAPAGSKAAYKAILAHYYPGTTVDNWYK
ncbi:MAG: SpoIID/LytB domain-containing protein [Sporomusaceae bacterium]|nr:SpoIID/LytB domain-containing protein [Sporomusaceae bacterium]